MARLRKALAADAVVPPRFDLTLRGLDAPDADVTDKARDRVRVKTMTAEPDVYNRRVDMLVSLHARLHGDVVRALRDGVFDIVTLERVYADGVNVAPVAAWVRQQIERRDTIARDRMPSAGLVDLIDEYLRQEGGRAPQQKRQKLERFMDALGGPARAEMAMVTRNSIAAFLAGVTHTSKAAARHPDGTIDKKGKRAATDVLVSGSTYNRYLDTIRGFTTWAKKAGHLTTDPYADDAIPKRDENPSRLPDLTPQDYADYMHVIEANRPELVLFVEMLVHTGIDVSEAEAMEVKDLNFLPDGSARLRTIRNKTLSPERQVPVPNRLVEKLHGRIGMYGLRGSDRVFQHGLSARKLRTWHEKARVAIHRPELRIKDFRHIAAIYWRREGVDIQRIQGWLGHATIQQSSVYTAFGEDHATESPRANAAADRLASAMDVASLDRRRDITPATPVATPARTTGRKKA